MATFQGPGIRVLKQYQGEDGKTYVQLSTGETLATDSSDYQDYYAEGLLYGEDERGNFYPQEGAHDILKQYQQLTQQNSFENYMKPYFDDEMTGSIAKGLGQSMDKFWEVNPSYKQNYDNEMQQQLVNQYLKNNPRQSDEERGAYFNRINKMLPNEVRDFIMDSGNSGVEPGYWADFRRGLYTTMSDQFGGGDQQLIKSINQDPNLTSSERNKLIYDIQYGNYGGTRKVADKLGVLAPLAVPAKVVQSAYMNDYQFEDAIAGRKNNATLAEDILTDPLTYAGLGIAENAGKITGAAGRVLSKIPTEAEAMVVIDKFGEAKLPNAYKYNPFAFRPKSDAFYRQLEGDAVGALDESMGLVKGSDFGPASFSKGATYTGNNTPEMLIEARNQSSNFTPVEDLLSGADNVYLSNKDVDILGPNVNRYQRDWLTGYKRMGKPNGVEVEMGNGLKMRRMAESPDEISVYQNVPEWDPIDEAEYLNTEEIRLKKYQEDGEDFYNFYANMPSSKVKAGKAYYALDKFIPVGGRIREDGSLSWDSFQNVLKKAQEGKKFEAYQDGFIPMNGMSTNEAKQYPFFGSQEKMDEMLGELYPQLDELGFDRPKLMQEESDKFKSIRKRANFPNIVLKKNYQQGGVILPDWLFE
jgi:hypothetical protein